MSVVVALDAYGTDLTLEQEILTPSGARVVLVSDEPAQRDRELAEAVGLLVVDHPVEASLLASTPSCRVVATYGVGVDNIDLEAARSLGVIVANVPDYCEDEVAEHAVALWLACERRIVQGDAMVRRGDWDGGALGPMRRLRGTTFGLVGFGRIARQVAQRVRGFGVSVVAYDPALADVPEGYGFIELMPSLDALLDIADIVSVHVPLTAATRHTIDAEAISMMRPGAVLINTSRGALVDEAALMDALRDGRLAGAGLDVLTEEPPSASFRGRDLANLVVTPHVAFASTEAVAAAKRGAAEAIAQALRNEPVRNRVA
jgi:D-3-phosphoglycerate dehydrogenase